MIIQSRLLPSWLLPHEVTHVQPSIVDDEYGNEGRPDYTEGVATRTLIRAAMQQVEGQEVTEGGGRDALVGNWRLLTNHMDVKGRDRIEWQGATFEVIGPPDLPTTPVGIHHVEALLRTVDG